MASVTFLSNAGVLLDMGGRRLMVDGIYRAEGLPFSEAPPELLERAEADYLAFTHTHHDHLDRRRLEDYLARHDVQGLLLPPRVRVDLHGADARVMKGRAGTETFPGLRVDWYRTAHLDHARPEHYSLVVRGGGATVLVAGDAMPLEESFAPMALLRPDAVLVTPPFLQAEEGRALLSRVVQPRRVLLYHIPRPQDDAHGLGRMAARQAERWGETCPITVLTQPGQRVELKETGGDFYG